MRQITTNMTINLEQHVQSRFSNNTFLSNNHSVMSNELAQNCWQLPIHLKDRLQTTLATVIYRKSVQNIVSQVLTAAQCYVKCLQIDPEHYPNPWELDLTANAGNLNSKFNQATFYPEFVVAGANASTNITQFEEILQKVGLKPTLQCQ